MDDPWNVRTGRHARILGGYIGSNITPPPYLSCYRERTMTTYYATPRSFFIIIAGHRPVSNERPPFVRNYKLVAPFRPESKPNLTENIYVPPNRKSPRLPESRWCRAGASVSVGLLSPKTTRDQLIKRDKRGRARYEVVGIRAAVRLRGGVASVRDYPAM